MSLARVGAALLAFIAGTAAMAAPDAEVYVWQRQWTPALSSALADSREGFAGVRVLVAQVGRDGGWIETQADPASFIGDTRALTAVIRHDGAGTPPDPAALADRIERLRARWHAAGTPFTAVEIDYDCAESRLADYAVRLRALRAALPPDLRLSITALPAWLDARALDDVLAAADEAVLQVHAVQRPGQGLFDADSAERWSRAFAARTRKPFRIALPAYGSRVRLDARGRALAVESEMPVDGVDGDDARELAADPGEVVALLARLDATPPAHWRGTAWFRLPLAGDRRAWTLPALREVMRGEVPRARFQVSLRTQPGGATDIAVINRGGVAAPAPALRIADAGCTAHDAPGDWSARIDGDALRFEPKPDRTIAPGRRRAVGWVRCARSPDVMIDGPDGKESP